MNGDEKINILLVEDDINLGFLLSENLKNKGFNVQHAVTGSEALRCIAQSSYDICIFDIMLPEVDGFTIADVLRKKNAETPFLFLTARSQEVDKILGFEAGADDYITKPFSFKELYYRILVILRRAAQSRGGSSEETYKLGPLVFDAVMRQLTISGHTRKLSQREADLLAELLRQQGSYVQRSDILKKVWGNDDYFTAKSMDVYITRIRKLLKDIPGMEIENLYGRGYRIRYSPESSGLPASF